jgi:5'-nucleotidase
MKSKRKSIAIDMDNVIADVVIADVATHFINWYERDYGLTVEKESLLGIPEMDAFPDGAVMKFLFTPGFFRSVPVMPGAQAAVKKLMEDFDVYIVSAAMEFPHALFEKYEWLKEHFPFVHWRHIIFCGDKSVIATDYLIDDHCKNLDTCHGQAIIYTAAHNVNVTHHKRVNDWDEVLSFMSAV